jgi:hypothetical protein
MELSQNTVTDAGTASSPFSRRPPQPKSIPSARIAAPNLAPQSAPSAPTMRTAPAVVPGPGSITGSVEQQQLERRRRIAARWFYWIAGVSLVNTVVALAGEHWRFIIGLGTTQVVNGLAARTGQGWAPAILLDLLLIGGFVLLGYLALQRQHWAFPVGIGVYALDGLIFVAARHWVGLAFHVFVLIMIGKGFQAARQLDRPSTHA